MNSDTTKYRKSSKSGRKAEPIDLPSEPRGPGRPRDEEVRRRILSAAVDLMETVGFANVTMDAIAERSGASKATIYRWWTSKAAVLIEAFRDSVDRDLPFPDTGTLASDIRQQLCMFAALLRGSRGRVIAAFMAGAQTDSDVAEALRQLWIAPRRAEAKEALQRHVRTGDLRPNVDLDLAVEMLYAPLFYRLLTGYGPLSDEYAEELADAALRGLQKCE